MTKHNPATPLPLSIARNVRDTQQDHARIDDANGQLVATISARVGRQNEAEQFARYIAHSANAYPKLVEALRAYADASLFISGKQEENAPELKRARTMAFATLRELGEIE